MPCKMDPAVLRAKGHGDEIVLVKNFPATSLDLTYIRVNDAKPIDSIELGIDGPGAQSQKEVASE